VGAEALAEKRRVENEKKAGMVPRLRVQERIDDEVASPSALPRKMPPLPPKTTGSSRSSMLEYDEEKAWFRIKSPREEHGAVGPSTVKELGFMYMTGEINDQTMLWREGNKLWEPLAALHQIRGKVQGMPQMPRRPNEDEDADEVLIKDDLPRSETERNVVKLAIYRTELWCGLCKGNLATSHMPGYAEQHPDLTILRKQVGSTDTVREIMDGFLFIGNKDSAKLSSIVPMGLTLIIGTADKLKNPAARPPHFRCQMAKLKDRGKFQSMPAGWMTSVQVLENGGENDTSLNLASGVSGVAENVEEEEEEEEMMKKIGQKGEGEGEDEGADEGVDEAMEPVESADVEPETSPGAVTTDANGRLLPRYGRLVAPVTSYFIRPLTLSYTSWPWLTLTLTLTTLTRRTRQVRQGPQAPSEVVGALLGLDRDGED